jgi:hypothetical protein
MAQIMDHQLTDSEKHRLEAQVAYAAALIRASEPEKSTADKFSAFFAHPAIITILGSGLLAIGVAIYQHNSEEARRHAEHLQQIREKRFAIATAVPTDLHKAGTILINLQKLRVALATSKYPEGATHDEVFSVFKTVLESYIKEPHHVGTLAQIDAWFACDSKVVNIDAQMDRIFEDFESLKGNEITAQKLSDFDQGVESKLRELTHATVAAIAPGGKCY